MGGVVGGLAKAVVGGAASRLFGGRRSRSPERTLEQFRPTGFTSSGINVTPTGETIDITRSGALNSNLQGISSAFTRNSSELRGLQDRLQPGFGELTKASVNSLRSRSRKAIGNLRESLARRRVAGSSFANDALTRAEAEFAREEAEIVSTNKLAEIDATNQVIQQRLAADVGQYQAFIDQFNLEAQIGTQLASGATAAMQSNSQLLASLRADSVQARGALFAPAVTAVQDAVGSAVEEIFK